RGGLPRSRAVGCSPRTRPRARRAVHLGDRSHRRRARAGSRHDPRATTPPAPRRPAGSVAARDRTVGAGGRGRSLSESLCDGTRACESRARPNAAGTRCRRLVGASLQAGGFASPALPGRQGAEAGLMDEGAERPRLFAKGGIGRVLLVLALGATLLPAGACGAFIALIAGLEHFLPSNDEGSAKNEEIASAKNEGAAFASGRTVTECVTEAQARGAARCNRDGLASPCGPTVAAFARACVSTATEDGYCATTPQPPGDDVFSKLDDLDAILEWPQAACKE